MASTWMSFTAVWRSVGVIIKHEQPPRPSGATDRGYLENGRASPLQALSIGTDVHENPGHGTIRHRGQIRSLYTVSSP